MIGCFLMLAMLGGEQEVANYDPYDWSLWPASLRGLECVRVSADTPKDGPKIGLTTEALRTTVELRLRTAGVTVVDNGSRCGSGASPGLVRITVFGTTMAAPDDKFPFVFFYSLTLFEDAQIERNGRAARAATWRSPLALLHVSGQAKETIQSTFRDMADKLANDYLKANPKGEQKKGDGK